MKTTTRWAPSKSAAASTLLAHLDEDQLRQGLITASTGNHGQSVANAGRIFGAKVVVVVPEGANPLKVRAMRNLGADVRFHGPNFDQAREYSERLAKEEGYRYVHAANEPLLVAGVATYALEILEEFPDVDYIIAPLGGGSGAAGCSIVAKAVNPRRQGRRRPVHAGPGGDTFPGRIGKSPTRP